MKRFELGMTLNYASKWTVVDAVREFFQNAYDEEIQNPANKMFFEYKDGVLSIGNKNSKLEPNTLLMGSTSKADRKDLIGEHGEGYKVATVVLMRNGVTVKIYNNASKEVWTSRLVKSRRYKTDIVVFDIEKEIFKKKCNLIFELDGITEEMYADIVKSNLHLRQDLLDEEVYTTPKGRVLLGSEFKGHIYVNGLFVCYRDFLNWGYDFSPELVSLDRDRALVDYFDLKFAIASLVKSSRDSKFIYDNIDNTDLEYIDSYSAGDSVLADVGNKIYDSLAKQYGSDFYPVSDAELLNTLGGNVVYVPRVKLKLMRSGGKEFKLSESIDLNLRFSMWRDSIRYSITQAQLEEIDEIWELAGGQIKNV